MTRNQEIRELAKAKNVRMYELADALGLSESGLYWKLRHELSEELRSKLTAAIDEISAEKAERS